MNHEAAGGGRVGAWRRGGVWEIFIHFIMHFIQRRVSKNL